jgi:hypothetical protein
MLIERISRFTGEINVMEIDVTQHQLNEYYSTDSYIQDVLAHLTADEREFIKTGVTAEEWAAVFEKEE